MNILIKFAFEGTRYHGWQVQQNAISVCTVLQDAIEKVWGTRLDVKGCSRTDSGVHALEYCISMYDEFDKVNIKKIPLALNAHLPMDIRVLSAEIVADDFHARYSSQKKQYTYKIRNSWVSSPFYDHLEWRIGQSLDFAEMQKAAEYYVGKQSFASFMSGGSKIVDTVREVYEAKLEKNGDEISFYITADGYLYNMVRIMVGTLAEVGMGRIKSEDIPYIIKTENRKLAGPRAPAKGLFLSKVYY